GEGKEELQSSAKEYASQAVAAEQREAFEQWEQKFAAARAEVSNEADRAIEKIQKEIDERTKAAHSAAAEGLKQDLPGWVAPQLERVTQELTARIANAGASQAANEDQHLADLSERVAGLLRQLEESSEQLNQRANEADSRIVERMESAVRVIEEKSRQQEELVNAHRDGLNAAAQKAHEQLHWTATDAKSALEHHAAEHLGGVQSKLKDSTDAA